MIRNERGLFAIRYAGQDDLKGVEAFYRMNKARSYESFTDALAMGSIPSLDFIYADKSGRIANIYNGAFPQRDPAHDWTQAVAGNVSATLWKTYFPFSDVPKVVAPGSGFVISANASAVSIDIGSVQSAARMPFLRRWESRPAFPTGRGARCR